MQQQNNKNSVAMPTPKYINNNINININKKLFPICYIFLNLCVMS